MEVLWSFNFNLLRRKSIKVLYKDKLKKKLKKSKNKKEESLKKNSNTREKNLIKKKKKNLKFQTQLKIFSIKNPQKLIKQFKMKERSSKNREK